MALQMVDGEQRLGVDHGDGPGRHGADDQPARQPGAGRDGDAVERFKGRIRLRHCRRNNAIQAVEMGAGGDFRHDAAEGRMGGDLAGDDVGGDDRRAVHQTHHAGGGLVAARLDAKDSQIFHVVGRSALPLVRQGQRGDDGPITVLSPKLPAMISTRSIPAPDRVTVRRALLSVFDKTGLVELGRALAGQGRGTAVHRRQRQGLARCGAGRWWTCRT